MRHVYKLVQLAVCLSRSVHFATYKIIISIKLPKLILRSAPILSPISRAMHSVAKVNRFDSGMTAKAFEVNTTGAFPFAR